MWGRSFEGRDSNVGQLRRNLKRPVSLKSPTRESGTGSGAFAPRFWLTDPASLRRLSPRLVNR